MVCTSKIFFFSFIFFTLFRYPASLACLSRPEVAQAQNQAIGFNGQPNTPHHFLSLSRLSWYFFYGYQRSLIVVPC